MGCKGSQVQILSLRPQQKRRSLMAVFFIVCSLWLNLRQSKSQVHHAAKRSGGVYKVRPNSCHSNQILLNDINGFWMTAWCWKAVCDFFNVLQGLCKFAHDFSRVEICTTSALGNIGSVWIGLESVGMGLRIVQVLCRILEGRWSWNCCLWD